MVGSLDDKGGMPRGKRLIAPGLPHHVTHRGVRRQNVFFCEDHFVLYLQIFQKYSLKYGLEVLAYCLMDNHVHFLVVPEELDSLTMTMQLTQKIYAERVNKEREWKGHMWEDRYFSSILNEEYLWVCLRYIERNPVEASMVRHPADYRWSSARTHCGMCKDLLVDREHFLKQRFLNPAGWYDWLSSSDHPLLIEKLQRRTKRNWPCGDERFLERLDREMDLPSRPQRWTSHL